VVSHSPNEHPFVLQAAAHSVKTNTSKIPTIVAIRRKPTEMESTMVLIDKLNLLHVNRRNTGVMQTLPFTKETKGRD